LHYMPDPRIVEWARVATPWFKNQGAASKAAYAFALLFALCWAAGLSPRIARIYSDPERQRELQRRWDRGEREGLRVRPATSSKHSLQDWLHRPASIAIDMPTNNDRKAALIAAGIALGTGISFQVPDPGHYYFVAGN